ncbi:amino acid synthesis family protein [Pseudonocardia sp. HH130630-07]|uniref:amino acid synthesis family protein n=1 Tax=Pseudonocardia sp. HH130630-07 TaxID=1690815 RepID=UPI0008153034|nr:amino acid synthesis family protein [Pseudonocardia sp. HH130630-07]ANY09458.1 peptide synthetase [Pseudonocardia sp. HH130630-07]
MSVTIRTVHTVVDEIHTEGGRPVEPAARVAVVLAVIENPWAGRGFVDDLGPTIDEVAPELGKLLSDRVVAALGAPVEAFGKAAIVGLDGEIEHGSGLIHTLKFGNHFRDAADATTLLPAVEKRAAAGTVFDIPLKHVTDATIRSHHQTVEARVPDGPRADEIVVGLAAAAQGRPQARLAPLASEK